MNNKDITKEFFDSKEVLMRMTKELVTQLHIDDETAQNMLDEHNKELDNLMECYGKLLEGFLTIKKELKVKEKTRDIAVRKLEEKEALFEAQLNAFKTSK